MRRLASNCTWMPGCIWDISCNHELPERGSLMTMYGSGLLLGFRILSHFHNIHQIYRVLLVARLRFPSRKRMSST